MRKGGIDTLLDPVVHPKPDSSEGNIAIMQFSITSRMSLACGAACLFGAIIMAITGHLVLMGIFLLTLLACMVGLLLLIKQRITNETASLLPVLVLCFLYTPASWFTFDGLMGCTPYLTILFSLVILLSYYRQHQTWLLTAYGLVVVGLVIHWFATHCIRATLVHTLFLLASYAITITLTLLLVESVKRKHLEINRRIIDLSQRDPLTQLFNRRGIEQAMAVMEHGYTTSSRDYALVMLDVDRFKHINDDFGHNLGDSVLRSLAECIRKSIRSTDYAGRFGGDEFLLILTHVEAAMVDQVRDRILAALRDVQGYAFPITASIGYALRSESATGDATLDLADQRMYENKNREDAPASAAP